MTQPDTRSSSTPANTPVEARDSKHEGADADHDIAQDRGRRRRFLVAVPATGLVVALILESASVTVLFVSSSFHTPSERLRLGALVALALVAVNLLYRFQRQRLLTWLGLLSVVTLLSSQVLDAVGDSLLPKLDPVMAAAQFERIEAAGECLLLAGLAMVLVTAHLTLIDSLAARQRLAHEKRRLARQIGQRQKIEDALKKSEERHRLIFEGA
ncbi:MAG: hypothetical protein HZB26_02210, partial [Candidatus Hydrogenedentes bacterium]|nr:hypothetical protein [Candidatus Hydrogenedentota bacterium]